jgi:aldo/keto reductase family protein
MFYQVAIAYVMQKTPYVFPIVGGRKVEHLLANIEALDITLSNDQIKYLESVVPFEPGFPYNLIVSCLFFFFFSMVLICVSSQGGGQETVAMISNTTTVVKGPLLQPLRS